MKSIAWYDPTNGVVSTDKDSPLFTPLGQVLPLYSQREWVGLTDDEMTEIVTDIDVDWGDLLWKVVCLTKIIEAKLKEKNGH